MSLVYFTNRPLERSTLWTELNGRIRRKGQYKVNLTVGWWAVKSVCARKSRGSEGRKAKLSSDLKFWHNPLLLHEEGRKEDEVETLDRPVMIIQSEVGCVCGMCNFLYITTRRVPIPHQRLVRLKSRVEGGARHLTHIQSSSIKHYFHTHPHFIVNHQLFYSNDLISETLPSTFPPAFVLACNMSRQVLCNAATCSRADVIFYSVRPRGAHFGGGRWGGGGGGGSGEGSRGRKSITMMTMRRRRWGNMTKTTRM